MTCTKTGCHVYLPEYGEYIYGDAYEVGGTVVLRISERSFRGPIIDRLHYTVFRIGEWFEKDRAAISTLVSGDFVNHGYEGVSV